jgi:flagellar assembly factor FliW
MSTEYPLPVRLTFPNGIPGFPGIEEGRLERGDGPIMALHVGADRLPVVVPWDVDPDFGYRFLPQYTEGLGDPEEWTVVCVVNLPGGNRRGTINRFAPIIVNEWEGVAAQVVNSAGDYSTRDPLTVELIHA